MEELIKQIAEQLNIPEEHARQAVNMVMGFVKDKLPAGMTGQLDDMLGGLGDMMDDAQGEGNDMVDTVKKGLLGGLFGKKD